MLSILNIFIVLLLFGQFPHKNKQHTATVTCNSRIETGRKSDSRIVRIVRFVGTAVRRFI